MLSSPSAPAADPARDLFRNKIPTALFMLIVCGVILVLANYQLLQQGLHIYAIKTLKKNPPPQASVFNEIEYLTVDNATFPTVYADFEIQSLHGVCQPRNHTSERAMACCLGTSSAGGRIFYDPNTCRDNRHEFSVLPARRDRQETDQHLGFRTAADVIVLLGNRTLSFIGDSVMNQMHQAFQCGIFRQESNVTEVEYQGYAVQITGNDTRPGPNWRYTISDVDHTVYRYKNIISKVNFFRVYRPWMPMDGPLLLKHNCHSLSLISAYTT